MSDPTSPTSPGCAAGDGYVHDAECLVYRGPDTRYTGRDICYGYNEDTITIVSGSPATKPVPGNECCSERCLERMSQATKKCSHWTCKSVLKLALLSRDMANEVHSTMRPTKRATSQTSSPASPSQAPSTFTRVSSTTRAGRNTSSWTTNSTRETPTTVR